MTTTPTSAAASSSVPRAWLPQVTWLVLAALAMLGQGGATLGGGADPVLSSVFEDVAVAGGDESRRLVQRQASTGRDQDVEHDSPPDAAFSTTTTLQSMGDAGGSTAVSTPLSRPSSEGRYRLHAPRGPPAA
ncbi:MAG: hypothetical protein KF911_08850 [Pseudomonadales bacterium]|nr:hypothetical protein [Pseudomonadales bacterium]